MAVFLCLEQLVDLLPVITRRVQPVGKRPVRFDGEFDVRLVAYVGNACAVCQHRQAGSTERGAEISIRRMGKPEDLAGMAVFLASDDSDYVVAQTYNVDGGQWMS